MSGLILVQIVCKGYQQTTLAGKESKKKIMQIKVFKYEGYRGGSRISGKEDHMYKDVGVRFSDFISFFLNIP